LEASPVVYISDQRLFDQLKSIDFAEICITSSIEVHFGSGPEEVFSLDDVDGVGVSFKVAEGEKCARCWKFVEKFSDKSGYGDVCSRCSDALILK
jgi:isoleucyl-tRNA synthetase